MSASLTNTTSLNPSVIDLKKTNATEKNKMTPKQDINKIIRVTVKVFIKIVAIFFGGSIFSYYCIISYAHLFPELQQLKTEEEETKALNELNAYEPTAVTANSASEIALVKAYEDAKLKTVDANETLTKARKEANEKLTTANDAQKEANDAQKEAKKTNTLIDKNVATDKKTTADAAAKEAKHTSDLANAAQKVAIDATKAENIAKKNATAGYLKSHANENVKNPFFQDITLNTDILALNQSNQKDKNTVDIPMYIADPEKKKDKNGVVGEDEDDDKEAEKVCKFIVFNKDQINKQFAGTYSSTNKKVDASLLYSLSDSKPDSYTGAKFISYSMINFMQGLIVADFTIIRTYFEFFYSFCSESFRLMFGWFFLIPFAFIYMFCHSIATMGYTFIAVMDLFKMKKCDHTKDGTPIGEPDYVKNPRCVNKDVEPPTPTEADKSGWIMSWFKSLLPKSAPPAPKYVYTGRDHESMTWLELIARIAFIFPLMFINYFISIFCGFYALFKALGLRAEFKVQRENKSDLPEPPFTFLTFMKNNLSFYSRAYLIMFSLLLIYESYVDMDINTAIGCVIAIIILVFGTSIFKKFTPPVVSDEEINNMCTFVYEPGAQTTVVAPAIAQTVVNQAVAASIPATTASTPTTVNSAQTTSIAPATVTASAPTSVVTSAQSSAPASAQSSVAAITQSSEKSAGTINATAKLVGGKKGGKK